MANGESPEQAAQALGLSALPTPAAGAWLG